LLLPRDHAPEDLEVFSGVASMPSPVALGMDHAPPLEVQRVSGWTPSLSAASVRRMATSVFMLNQAYPPAGASVDSGNEMRLTLTTHPDETTL